MSDKPKISDEAVEAAGARLKLAARAHGAFTTEHTMRNWAREALTAAYPLLRQQWEVDFLERLKRHGGDQWLEGYEAGCSMSHSLGCDAVEAQRDALVEQNGRLSVVVAEAIAREIESRIRVWAGMSQQAEAGNEHLRQAARIARAAGERLIRRPNGTETDRA